MSKKKPIIVHQIFEDARAYSDNNLWTSLFIKFAKGKFPRDFLYRDDVLSYKHKKTYLSIHIPSDPGTAYAVITDFLRSTGLYATEEDIKRSREIQDEICEQQLNIRSTKWTEIKSPKLQAILIDAFINNFADEGQLSKASREQLRECVNMGLCVGYLNKNNIVFENGKVVEITGVYFDEEDSKFKIEECYRKKVPSRSKSSKGSTKKMITPLSLWNDYNSWWISQNFDTTTEETETTY